jgi:hypothetical protein
LPVTTQHGLNDSYTRYVLVNSEAPALTNIAGLIRGYDDALAAVVVDHNGDSEPVQLEQDTDTGVWTVWSTSTEDTIIEQVAFSDNGEVVTREVFIDGFDTDEVPIFGG